MPTLIDAFPLIKSLRDAVFLSAEISEIEQLTPRLRRIRFEGPRLQGLNWKPGQHIRLQSRVSASHFCDCTHMTPCGPTPSTRRTPTSARSTS
jgi:NADPH-dependent ferric siderophore reductase